MKHKITEEQYWKLESCTLGNRVTLHVGGVNKRFQNIGHQCHERRLSTSYMMNVKNTDEIYEVYRDAWQVGEGEWEYDEDQGGWLIPVVKVPYTAYKYERIDDETQ